MTLSERDYRALWHPFSQAKLEGLLPAVLKARGTKLYLEDGREIIDAVSSWWVNLHGHSHPHIAERVAAQAKFLEHVIFAGFTHAPAVELAEGLLRHAPKPLSRVFYSDNGSTAVETALKIAMQFLVQTGQKRHRIVALRDCYHGDTFGAMSANERHVFNAPFAPYLFEVERVAPPRSADDPVITEFEALVKRGEVGMFIFEPCLQGVAGMKIYSPEGLTRMLRCCREEGVLSIADEVLTGFGRTGRFFASDYLGEAPDLMCLSKGLTGGFLPLGATLASEEIYQVFYSDDRAKMLFHGHSYTANPLACSAALASLELMEQSETWERIATIEALHRQFLESLCEHPLVAGAQVFGTLLRFEVRGPETTGYLNSLRDFLYREFFARGVLLRPLGNVVYVLPPYCIADSELTLVYQSIQETLEKLLRRERFDEQP